MSDALLRGMVKKNTDGILGNDSFLYAADGSEWLT